MDTAAKLNQLIDDAEELLTKLAGNRDPDIQMLRDRVDDAIQDCRKSIDKRGDQSSLRLLDVARTINHFVQNYPWAAFLSGIVTAGSIAFLAGSFVGSRRQATH